MLRHGRDSFFIVGEGVLTADTAAGRAAPAGAAVAAPRLSEAAEIRQFRFSRIGPQGTADEHTTRGGNGRSDDRAGTRPRW